MDYDISYEKFASSLHFFEFIQSEYYEPGFDINAYEKEISIIEGELPKSKGELAVLLRQHPKIFDIIEQVYQLKRFTNTHYLNFIFDVGLLNRSNWKEIFEYLLENLTHDSNFKELFMSSLYKEGLTEEDLTEQYENNLKIISIFKKCVVQYATSIADDKTTTKKYRKWFFQRIQKIDDVSERIAEYLTKQRDFPETFISIKPRKFLETKRIPYDSKSFSGNYGNYIIKNFLKEENIADATEFSIRGNSLHNPLSMDKNNFIPSSETKGLVYTNEMYIEGIKKRTSGKLKKFDYILFKNGIPKICIETNFYSTSGTKIGINENEYRILNEDMKNIPLQFWWVTDGNYWLTNDGKERYIRCIKNHNMVVYNYNQFKERVKEIKNG